jgi:hypothetical protein
MEEIAAQHYVRDVRHFIGFQITEPLLKKVLRSLKQGATEIKCRGVVVPFTRFEDTLLFGASGKAGVGCYVVRHPSDRIWKILTPEAFHREYAVQDAEPIIDAQGASAVPLPVPWFVTPACERALALVRELLGTTEAEAADFVVSVGLKYLQHLHTDDTLRNIALHDMDKELHKQVDGDFVKALKEHQ